MKILIAEDETVSRRTLMKNVQDWGYEAVEAKNGKEAWKIIDREEIHLAILDWIMPGLDGIELCRKIREQNNSKASRYIYIIFLTGKDRSEEIIRGLEAGADDYMTKPVSLLELKFRLRNGERILSLQDSLVKLASYDSLTQLWNRDKIMEFLGEELNRALRHSQPTGVIMADIDYFKQINDTYGHLAGDRVLSEVSSRIIRSVRSYDRVGRYGGDEMLVVLPDCILQDVKEVAERIRLAVAAKKFSTEAGDLEVKISLGGTSSDNFFKASINGLITTSDQALYLAKNQGRNQTVAVAFSPA